MTTNELRQKWAQMTQEQRRVAVAECAGWKKFIYEMPAAFTTAMIPPGARQHVGKLDIPPDYLNSLDAIAQAVAGMPHERLEDIPRILCIVLGRKNLNELRFTDILTATSAQLSEAYWLAMREKKP